MCFGFGGGVRRRGLHAGFVRTIGVGDFARRAVTRHDPAQHCFVRFLRVLRQLRAQVFLRVVERVLDQRAIGALQFGSKQVEVFLDGAGCRGRHDGISCAADVECWTIVSTKARVPSQVSRHAASTSRPSGVIR